MLILTLALGLMSVQEAAARRRMVPRADIRPRARVRMSINFLIINTTIKFVKLHVLL